MKTKVNKIRFVLMLGFLAIGMTAWGQIPHIEKLSVSTQMFLDEMAGKVSWEKPKPTFRATSTDDIIDPNITIHERPIASPDTIDGKAYISSFIRVTDDDDINILESLGVKIECRFDNGLLTALIPVDRILDVAAIDDVVRIEVATVMSATTDNARQTTNADDVLTLSQDALAAGLNHRYDGSGVILGIIDVGIDYQHQAFKDKDGNSRIKGVYCYGSNSVLADWSGSGTLPTTDNSAKDHGTHTSSIAGGSNVITDGSNVTVTDVPASATYGGMAPGVDLYLAGVNTLYSTRISNAFQKMANYANAQGQPLFVSNSYGSMTGPHDGTGAYADVIQQYFGNDQSNRVCLFSAGNEAGNADETEGGGCHIYGTVSSSNPLRSILRCHYYSNRDNGYYYTGNLASAWSRSTSVTDLRCRIMVLDTRTGNILTTINVTPSTSGTAVSGLSTYYSGTLTVYKDYSATSYSGKTQIYLTATSDMKSKSYDTSNSSFYTSNYTLAVEFYPASGSAEIDAWTLDYCYFTDYLTTSGYNWIDGSDDMSVNDLSNNPNIIVVGSYTSRERSSSYNLGDISKFSSYATESANLMGKTLPWITAPGEVIIAAYNHNNTSRGSNYVVTVNNSTSPYGQMSGTSMACPSAAGIVALWMQAAQEVGESLTLSKVKEIMKETAIRDYWVTDGPHASHFGNGKIDALAGIQYILSSHRDPIITANPTEVNFEGEPGKTYTQTVNITSQNLTGNITATLSDENGVFQIAPTSFTSNGDLIITFIPSAEGSYSATVTLTSEGAQPVTIVIHGTAIIINNTLVSNTVEVPVYHSDLQANDTYIFSLDEVNNDVDMNLPYTSQSKVSILVKSDAPITHYDLMHRDGIDSDWITAATAVHENNTYISNEVTMTFDDGVNQMWFPMQDNFMLNDPVTYYAPVTVANGIITQGNTYGAPITSLKSDQVHLNVTIGGSKSDGRTGGHWNQNGVEYCVYTPIITVEFQENGATTHVPYMYRAWLISDCAYDFDRVDGSIVGTTPLQSPYLLGEVLADEEDPTYARIGTEWVSEKLQNAFGAPCNGAQIQIAVRAYYQKGNSSQRTLKQGTGMFGFSQGDSEGNFDLPTGIHVIYSDRQVVGVTYVNALGMQSSEPFDGVNIVVTQYGDGSITTAKVLK
ncbi:MAG: S8 family serine peptidase [Muribaculaceae bacterium]|nr:S8 family serine peptidase [Muribaculaceae bacterium]